MGNNQPFITAYVDRLIEVDRLYSEGATLKNVSENMRALAVFIFVFAAISALWQSSNVAFNLAAIFWGFWTIAYAAMAALQCGILIGCAIGDALPWTRIRRANSFVQHLVLMILSLMAMMFVLTTAIFLVTTIHLPGGKP